MMPLFRPGIKYAAAAAGFSLLFAPALLRGQTAISPPISGPVSEPVYSESTLTGPSSTFVPGDRNLTTPFLRDGVSDPLGYLLESGQMSPFPNFMSSSTPYTGTQVFTLTSPTQEVQLGLGRSGSGAVGASGSGSLAASRMAFAGAGAVSARASSYGSQALGTSSGFGGMSTRAAFAAGRGGVGRGGPGGAGATTFLDPNALLASTTAPTGTSSMQAGSMPSLETGGGIGMSMGIGGDGPGGQQALGSVITPIGSTPNGQLAAQGFPGEVPTDMLAGTGGSAENNPTGPPPGSVFPVLSMGMSTGVGFRDSTQGTADLPSGAPGFTPSPLLSRQGNSVEPPFREMSDESTSFLHPSLEGREGATAAAVSLHEYIRKQRLKALIDNPGSPLPSAFDQRRAVRQFKNEHKTRRRTAIGQFPSVTVR